MKRFWTALGLAVSVSAQAADDTRLQPGQLRLLDLDPARLREVVPGAVYMGHWFGSRQSTALFRFPPAATSTAPAKLAFHSHGTEFAVQVAGDSEIVDERRRRYPLKQGDVVLVKANVRHTGTFGSTENHILSVVTPARPEYPPEDGTAYFPGHGQPATAAAPARTDFAGPTVRTLFNLATVESTLADYPGGGVAFSHWHGDDVSVAVTRLRREGAQHKPAAHAVHGEEVAWLARGRIRYVAPGLGVVTAEPGQAVVLPPYRAHSAQCLSEDCLIVSWHSPRRDEWGPEGSLPPLTLVSTGAGAVSGEHDSQCPCNKNVHAGQ
jgi:quercetin dioxygenase-like cupin family protein